MSLPRIFCFSLIFYCVQLYAQSSKIDSLKEAIVHTQTSSAKANLFATLSFEMTGYNLDSALLMAQQGIQLASLDKNDTVLANCYLSAGICYVNLDNKDSAEHCLLKADTTFYQLKDAARQTRCLLNLGNFYLDNHQYEKGINCLMKAKPLAEAGKEEDVSAGIDYILATAYADQGFYDLGKQYARSAISTFKRLNIQNRAAESYSALAYVFFQEGNYDSALYYYHIDYAIEKNQDDLITRAIAEDDIANVFLERSGRKNVHQDIDSALYYFKAAMHSYTQVDSRWNMKYEEINLGTVSNIMGEYKPAAVYLNSAFHYFDSTADINYAYSAANELSNLYKNTGDYKNAYTYNLVAQQYKDSLNKRDRTDSIAKIFARYETDKKEKQIQLLNAQSALDKSTLSRQRILMLFSVISLLLAAVLFIVLINRNRMKQQLKEIKVRNQLAGDLHDEVGSSLSSILLLSKMASGKADAQTSGKGMLDTIAANTKDVINKMNDIVWMMNPKYDEGENVREKLEQYVSNIQEATAATFQLHIAATIDAIRFPMETRKTVLLVCKEAVNNALKYSNASVIGISMNTENNHVQFIISDNGKGFNKDVAKEGNGLGTMNLRAKEINGKLAIQSSPGNGTQIKLVFPIPHSR